MTTLVYKGPSELRLVHFEGRDFLFEKDVPQDVPDGLAKSCIENNPEPWQQGYCDVYEVETGGGE